MTGLGGRGDQVVALYWDGDRLDWQLAAQVMSLSSDLLQTTEQHLAYPVLHAFHARAQESSAPRAVAVLDDAYVLLADGLAPQVRPSAAVLQPLRSALVQYAVTVASTAARDASSPPGPALGPLRAAGVPVVDDERFERSSRSTTTPHAAVRSGAERRLVLARAPVIAVVQPPGRR